MENQTAGKVVKHAAISHEPAGIFEKHADKTQKHEAKSKKPAGNALKPAGKFLSQFKLIFIMAIS